MLSISKQLFKSRYSLYQILEALKCLKLSQKEVFKAFLNGHRIIKKNRNSSF